MRNGLLIGLSDEPFGGHSPRFSVFLPLAPIVHAAYLRGKRSTVIKP
jgi:hypothetical protein